MIKPTASGELICKDLDLSTIPKNLFSDSEPIQSLDLRGNGLKTIENTAVFKLFNLKILDLRSNKIEYLSDEICYL